MTSSGSVGPRHARGVQLHIQAKKHPYAENNNKKLKTIQKFGERGIQFKNVSVV